MFPLLIFHKDDKDESRETCDAKDLKASEEVCMVDESFEY